MGKIDVQLRMGGNQFYPGYGVPGNEVVVV
jgi:hypothetical protein